ncbi:hypothetical protein D3C85_1075980 [compost metagenome]
MARRNVGGGIAVDGGGDGLCRQAGSRDQQAGRQHRPALPRIWAARRDPETPFGQRLGALERRGDHDRAARVFDLALQGQHIAMAVEQAALRRQDGGVGVQFRLQRPRLGAGQMFQPLDAVGRRLPEDGLDALDLGLFGRHDQLAALPVVDLVAAQKVIEGAAPLDAELRLQRAGRIIEPAVDDLGVSRGHALADMGFLLQHQNRQAAFRQRPPAGQPHSPRTHDRRIEVERRSHGPTSCRRGPSPAFRNSGSACRPHDQSWRAASCPASAI